MPQPPSYTPTTDFSQQEANNASGRSTVNTAALDTELANIETTLDQTLSNLTLLQRDDGRLKDLVCEVHTLSPEVLNLMGGFNLRGLWQAATAYAVNDIASNTEYTYRCRTAHTSGGAFDAQYWMQFGFSGGADAAQAAAAAQVSASAAAASANTATAAVSSASASATTATTQAGSASTSADTATTQAGNAATSATNASNSATAAQTAAANLPNAVTAGADKVLVSNPTGTAWLYKTAVQSRSFLSVLSSAESLALLDPMLFYKTDAFTPAFLKTAAATLSIKAGTSAMVAGIKVVWAVDTAITMPTLTGGTDYAIYVCTDGTIRADASMSYPTGYTTVNSRKVGGFHYGLVPAGTTVAGGSFATTGNGMIWTQGDVDKSAGINPWSIWDLKFRPACADPRGMVLVNGRTWVDIYLCNTDTAANGTSKAGSNIASGTVLPKVPVAFGGNGTLTYSTLTWWEASELARANQKRLLLASEFYDAAFGVTENQSIDATASTYPSTQRNAGYTSRYGIEQASGHHYIWGQDSAGQIATAYAANGGRGQSYNNSTVRVLLGGSRTIGSNSGSRVSSWNGVSSYSYWGIGLRAASDHLQIV